MPTRAPLLLLLALSLPTDALARRVFLVGASQDFTSIQSAVDAAQDGDRILVAAGSWSECLNIPVSLEIAGVGGTAAIDCGGAAAFALTPASGVSLVLTDLGIENDGRQGLSMVNGTLTGENVSFTGLGSSLLNGGAIAADGSTIRLRNASFTGNTGNRGGSIHAVGSMIYLQQTSFADGSAFSGGAAYLDNSSLALVNGTVSNHSAGNAGGAFYLADYDTLSQENALGDASALLLQASTLDVASAQSGGFIYVTGTGAIALVEHTTFSGGEATANGGAVFSENAWFSTESASFSNNSATQGGAVYATGSLQVRDSTLNNSSATSNGGAIAHLPATVSGASSSLSIQGSTFRNNTSGGYGGAVHSQSYFYVESSSFQLNSAVNGGAVATTNSGGNGGNISFGSALQNQAAESGGAFFAENASISISQFDVSNNTAGTMGGGLYFDGDYANLYESRFSGNQAGQGGGVFASTGSFDVRRTAVRQNTTLGSGGGIHNAGGALAVFESSFRANEATLQGGAIYSSGPVEVGDTRLGLNVAGAEGGAIATVLSSPSVFRSWFCENTAAVGAAAYVADMLGPFSWDAVALGENVGAGTVVLDGVSGTLRGGGNAYFNYGTSAGNTVYGLGVLTTRPVPTNPTSWAAYPVSYGNLFALTVGSALVTEENPNNYWSITNNVFQDNTEDVTPGGSWPTNVDGNRPMFPGYEPGTGCFADLLPAPEYINDPGVGFPERGYSADELFLDLDSDGQTFAEGDCAPYDPTAYVGRPEVPGDFVDNDCALGDDPDLDGDGLIYSMDCNEGDPNVPGAGEVYYNDINEDCGGIGDWDQDNDWFDLYAANHTQPEVGGLLGIDDCDDTDPSVYPGAPETWYDGIDGNCDGLNDFDQDYDGFVTPGATAGGSATGSNDCNDYRADVYPGATEVWYDGLDQDCGEDNDFDQDGDGYIAAGYEGNEGNLLNGDCDDADPSRSPGAVEIDNNGIDENCDTFDLAADTDTDGDGIPDLWENAAGSNPDSEDSDGDGISDGEEWENGCPDGTVGSTPVDTDGDGTADVLDDDSDGDGISDEEEGADDTDGDCFDDFADDDDDNDGIPTAEETANGTDPYLADTDGDSVPDNADLSPLDNGANGDQDTSPAPVEAYGCGCRNGGPVGALWLAPVALALVRRRSRGA